MKLLVFSLLKVNGEEGRIVKLILYDAHQCRVFEQVMNLVMNESVEKPQKVLIVAKEALQKLCVLA